MRLLFRNFLVLTLLVIAYPAQAVIVSPDLEVFTIPNVGNTPVTVNLQNDYISAIPICTYNIESATPVPAVVRIDNIMTDSFDVYLQKASSDPTAESPNYVHCVVSEEGEFTIGGLHWEARSKDATFTNRRGAFGNASDQVTNITGTFSNPIVVLHQVITSNDTAWSTSWAYRGTGGNIQNPPIVGSIYVGKHVAADTNTARANETVGYIVLETASGTVNGVAFDAALGGDTIDGVDNAGNTYTAPTIDYRHGIASQNAMDGGDGGWAVLFGLAPLAGDAITVAIDEDDIADTERAHTTEQVAYWLLEPVDVADLDISIDDGNSSYTPGTTVQYTAVLTNNGPNDASMVNLVMNAPAGTSISSWTCLELLACPAPNGIGDINQMAATLTNGGTLTYTVNVDVASSRAGALDLTASASNSNVDPITANDSATDSDTQSSLVNLTVTHDDGGTSYTPGTTVQYTLTVTNNGVSDSASVNVTNAAPAGTNISAWLCAGASCPAASGSGDINANIVPMAAGDAVIYTVDVSVPSSYSGNLDSTATASAAETDPLPGDNLVTDSNSQSSSADINVTNTDGTLVYLPGATSIYTVLVSNSGPSDASNVAFSYSTPAGTMITSWTCAGADCPNGAGSGAISENILSLAQADSVTYTVNLAVSFFYSGTLTSTASATASEADPNAANNSAADVNSDSPDTDGDGVPDAIEIIQGTDPTDPTDVLDTDNDGVPDFVELIEGTDPNDPASILDTDGDGSPDFVERGGDKEADGVGDEFESSITDTDGDLIADDLDSDADGDGVVDLFEGVGDLDGDGIPDFLDPIVGASANGGDSDSDGINDATECPLYPTRCPDSDGDRIPNYADSDDDNDGLLTALELGSGGAASPADSDSDLVADYLEPNNRDTDGDSNVDYLDGDDDGDGLATMDELDANNDTVGDALFPDDLDNEGIADYLDRDNGDGTGTNIAGSGDSDGDGMSDATECPQAPLCADSDGDGIPNYMIGSADSDGDGILDAVEIGGDPANPIDSDGDSVPDYLEGNTTDTDGDGVMNHLDDDDDGDGFPTIDEVGAGGALAAADSDGDGNPDYLSFSSVKTGVDGGAGSMGLFMGLFIWLIVLLKATITLVRNKKCPLRRQPSGAGMFARTAQIIIVAAFTSAAIADSQEAVLDDPFYIGFGGGMSFLEPESDSAALSLTEDSDVAYKLFGGYRFTQNLGMEVFWSDLGAAELGSSSNNNYDIEYRAYGIGGVYSYPLNNRWHLSAKAGVGRLENDAEDIELDRVNDNFIYVGAGATWNITGSWDLRAEYEHFDTDAQLLSLNLIKRFGTGTTRRISRLEQQIEEQNRQLAVLAASSTAAAATAAAATQTEKPAVECISTPVELRGVDFEYRSAELTETSRQTLDQVIEKIAELPADVRFEIRAHTDDIGTETYNYVLSLSRARNVRDYMVQNGITLDRIDAEGYGELHPVVANDTEQNRNRNRRAELVLLGMEKYTDGAGACTGPASSNLE